MPFTSQIRQVWDDLNIYLMEKKVTKVNSDIIVLWILPLLGRTSAKFNKTALRQQAINTKKSLFVFAILITKVNSFCCALVVEISELLNNMHSHRFLHFCTTTTLHHIKDRGEQWLATAAFSWFDWIENGNS